MSFYVYNRTHPLFFRQFMLGRFAFVTLIVTILFACSNTINKRRLLVEDVYAEGDISKDSVFNGLIRFYDTVENKLVMEANYIKGVLNGKQVSFYKNGKPETAVNYENGKINGVVTVYDSTGNITDKQTYYYDLVTGPAHEFKNGKISRYHFYSLDNKNLFAVDYEKPKKIEEINNKEYFFWNVREYITNENQTPATELFIYLPDPPKLNFRYSLCIIDKDYKVLNVVKEFDSGLNWETIKLNYAELKPGEIYALRLTVDNMLDEKEDPDDVAVMFKKL